MGQTSPLLSLKNVSKDFYGNVVLHNVSFDLHEGEILGLVGENGAGKTTLMSILFGMPVIAETGGFSGTIELNGQEIHFLSPFDALDAGLGMVHQEFSLIPGFTTTENIVLNRESMKPNFLIDLFGYRMSTLDRPDMRRRAEAAIHKLGVKLDPDMLVSEMPVGHKQFTEIAREISRSNTKILILDEPTAVLTESEALVLLDSLKKLAKEGVGIIFISHRLREVTDIADRIVVLRDGNAVKDVPAKGVTIKDIASWMVGRSISGEAAPREEPRMLTEEVLSVQHLWVDMPGETVRDVSFSVNKGEIFGIGGLAGQGKLGIPNGIMGLYPAGGKAMLNGKEILLNNPAAALKLGMAFVSEDRRGVGLLLDESLEWNIAFTAMQTHGQYLKPVLGGLFTQRDGAAMEKLCQEYIQLLDIKCTSTKQPAKELSGGNQQKICLAKAFALKPQLLFVSEPTRGIDVGAKAEIHSLITKLASEGKSIIMVSSEMPEVIGMSDRVLVVCQGRITAVLDRKDLDQETIMRYATSISNHAVA